jgi:hypothetical protein
MKAFITERVKSVVSKKLGVALLAEGSSMGTELQGYPLLIYIVVQGCVDAFKHWNEGRS